MLFDVWFYPTDVGELCLQSLRLVSLQKQLYYFLWDRKWKWAQSRETLICTAVLNKYRLSLCT